MLPYVYIAGLSHSGSTLLAFLLNAHPEVISIGEVSRIGEILPERWQKKSDLCSCGKSFYNCEFWNPALAGLAARGFGLDAMDPFDYPTQDKGFRDQKLKAFVESSLEISGAKVFVDASKAVKYVPILTRNPHLDVRILNLFRDGRGVIQSWKKRLENTPMEEVISEWVKHEKSRQAVFRVIDPAKILPVKYEDLCTRTARTLQKIFSFVGVAPEVDVVSGYKTRAKHHIIGNQMRLDKTEKILLDERWRAQVTPETRRLFQELGGQLVNQQNGYTD